MFILVVNFFILRSDNSFILEVWIVGVFVLEKVGHFLIIILGKEIFQLGGLVLDLIRLLLLSVLGVTKELVFNFVIKGTLLVHLFICYVNILF